MPHNDQHTQCLLQDTNGGQYTAWIPSQRAVKGKTVRIDDYDMNFLVVETYDSLDSKYVNERSQDYKRTRKASDI